MELALAQCFADPLVTAVLTDPLANNTRTHRFYQRLAFQLMLESAWRSSNRQIQ
jgi:aminoglycoside 6'-N-acetyltransferase